jgi:hypothetical protein
MSEQVYERASHPHGVDPDQLAELEDERRFLLRSLRDLDAELAAGDVDRADYEVLRDGYTKRAADVLRGIEEGRAALPASRPRRWRRTAALAAGVVVVAAVAGIAVARSQGERTAGDAITGGAGIEDTATLLAQARALLGVDPRAAQDTYERVLANDPQNAEALTYSGWLLFIASEGARPELRQAAITTAREQLGRAVAADGTYADPHCFLAVIAENAAGDTATARAEADRCLVLDPPADVRALIEPFAASLGSTPPSSTSPG